MIKANHVHIWTSTSLLISLILTGLRPHFLLAVSSNLTWTSSWAFVYIVLSTWNTLHPVTCKSHFLITCTHSVKHYHQSKSITETLTKTKHFTQPYCYFWYIFYLHSTNHVWTYSLRFLFCVFFFLCVCIYYLSLENISSVML